MKDNPLVSVIIPVYNSEKFIQECLQSVINQTYRDIEIIVVDDGSTDDTLSIIKNLNIRFIQQDNRGACAARNVGFEHSEGTYIQYLDADDLLSPDKIELQIHQLNGDVDTVSNGRWGRFYSEDPYSENILWGPHISLQMDLMPVDWLCQNHMSQTACWLTPRKLIEEAGTWDESLSINQDGEFFTRVVARSKRVLFCDDVKVYYRSRLKNSITSRAVTDKALESLYRTCRSFENIILQLENSRRTKLACANCYQQFVYKAYPSRMDLTVLADKKIRDFGGSSWPPDKGGPIYNVLMTLFGWKFPARLKYFLD